MACPCAFALAAPLAMRMTVGKLARHRILVKGSESLEKLAQVREVFFDKTGTLTRGELWVDLWIVESAHLVSEIERAVVALESSVEPSGRARTRFPFHGTRDSQ